MYGGLNMSANRTYLTSLIIFLNIPGFIIGYSKGYQNQLTPCFEAKYGWAPGHDQAIHNAYLGGSVMLGMTVGAVAGGIIMRVGRRRTLFISVLVGIVGNLCTFNL